MSSSSSPSSLSLSDLIKIAIANKRVSDLYNYKDICDRIFKTGKSYKSYNVEDLPTDTLYEEMSRTINSIATDMKILTQRGLENNSAYIRKDGQGVSTTEVKHRHEQYISDVWMGSITKLTEIKTIPNALILPKFDGCSCGARLKRDPVTNMFQLIEAVTRGQDQGYEKKQSNITEKLASISNVLIESLSTLEYEFTDGHKLSDVKMMTIRGEIVLKNREIATSAPASWTAGKINGYMEVWNDALENIEFVPYEIMRLYFSDDKYDIYVPTQLETIDLLDVAGLFNYPYDFVDLETGETSLQVIENYFNSLNETISEPIDGVVYCSQLWKYPLRKEEKTPKAYGKYAWKPSSEVTSILRKIDYSIARDGKITFILCYDPVNINGKNYKQAKTVTSRMMMLNGIGIGSVITVKLAADISPMVVDFVNENAAANDGIDGIDGIDGNESYVVPYELPKVCPFCGAPTKLKGGKTSTLSCSNPNCNEINKQKMINFLKLIGISGIAEGKLRSLRTVTFENVYNAYIKKSVPNVIDIFSRVDTRTFLMALGLGGKTKVDALIPSNMIATLSVVENFDNIINIVEPFCSKDPFVDEVINFMMSRM